MPDDNKHNIQYFESSSMYDLYNILTNWQKDNRKRLLSVNIQKDMDKFCCIALTNPTEVVLTDESGNVLETSHRRLVVDSR